MVVHLWIARHLIALSRNLRLVILENLKNFRLQQTQPEVVVRDVLVAGVFIGNRWLQETVRRNVVVVQDRWKICCYDLVADAKGPSNTSANEPVK